MTAGKVILNKFISNRISNGHPYIYQNEIEKVEGNPLSGSVVDVFTFSNQFVGRGFFNALSKIKVRLLTRRNEIIDQDFFEKKLHKAVNLRRKYLDDCSVCRLFNSDADGISGLVLDLFKDTAVIQFNTYGTENHKDNIIESLRKITATDNLLEKSDSSSRCKEGLPPVYRTVYGKSDTLMDFEFKGLKFSSDFSSRDGVQFYMEQRNNSIIASKLCREVYDGHSKPEILDVFCNNGNFGMRMLSEFDCDVVFIDHLASSIEECKKLVNENGFPSQKYIRANAFDYLREEAENGKKYSAVILDPPSFTTSRSSKGNALRGYKEVNLRAMKLLYEDGYLITSSCSKAVSREDFEMMIYSASTDLGLELSLIHRGGQPLDFPIITNIFETEFLKFYIYRVRRI